LVLAKQYHLPGAVRAFIPEHHGTTRVSFLYQKAVAAAGGVADLVDEEQFRYPGPPPQSRETLLVMLADGCEAATRARRPSTPEALAEVVDMIFRQRMDDGQMDECPITMAELDVVKQAYVDLLRGAFHPRVQYPSGQTRKEGVGQPAKSASAADNEDTERVEPPDAGAERDLSELSGAAMDAAKGADADPSTDGDGAGQDEEAQLTAGEEPRIESPVEELGRL
jgi:hypothetical protein